MLEFGARPSIYVRGIMLFMQEGGNYEHFGLISELARARAER